MAFERQAGLDYPAQRGFAITPSSNDLTPSAARCLWVGGAGTLHVRLVSGDEVTLSGVPAGTLLPISVIRVYSDSTATLIVGLY